MTEVTWKDDADQHDYPAAEAYLSLILTPDAVSRVLESLSSATVVTQKAKDIMRAARLTLLPEDDYRVASDLAKVKKGVPLSPVLLLRGRFEADVPLQIADGFHRVCASYYVDENTDIPCRIADLT